MFPCFFSVKVKEMVTELLLQHLSVVRYGFSHTKILLPANIKQKNCIKNPKIKFLTCNKAGTDNSTVVM